MRAKKAKNLRRMYWTRLANERGWCPVGSYRDFKKTYGKGVRLGLIVFYPRESRRTRELMTRKYWGAKRAS
jgi:hypothetical protein